MDLYQFFIDDERYGVPTFVIEAALDLDGARRRAEELLNRSSHHYRVGVYQEDDCIFTVNKRDFARAILP